MNTVRLLLLLTIIVGACNSPEPVKSDATKLQKEYQLIDSLARINLNSAFTIYNTAASNATDSGYKGTWLQRMATIQQAEGDFYGSNETALSSLKLFDEKKKKNYPNISYNYNLLAVNYMNLGRYDDALESYERTFQYSDQSNITVYINNKAVAFMKKKEYDSAITLFNKTIKEPAQDSQVYAMIRSNLAKAQWLKDSRYPALAEFHEARNIRELKNNLWGLNASYSHLSDYYATTRPDSALYYAKKMYEVANQLQSVEDQVEALEKMVRLSSGSDTKSYFDRYDFLNDSISLSRSNARNQFADTRFNIEAARADNLVLEKDNSQKRFRIARQRFIIYGTIALFFLLGILGINWYRKRKRLQDLQTKTAIRESELRTSQKVHDVVANGLYRIMTDLEHRESIEKEKLLDNIEELYEQSRDISYENTSPATGSFANSLNTLLSSFATPYIRVLTVGNNEEVWKDITPAVKKELEAVLQELMVNMKKHSQANNVVLNFQQSGYAIHIRYKDDGTGLPQGYRKGNGMSSTENRISGTGGTIIFDSVPGKGLTIDISIPINKTT